MATPKRFLIISQAPPWCIGVLSARRRPQPMSTASIARFRCARRSTPAKTPRRSLPCSADSPLPTHTPRRLATFTRRMPAAMSGLRRPQSAASYANPRTAASLRLTSRLVLICRQVFTNELRGMLFRNCRLVPGESRATRTLPVVFRFESVRRG